MERIATENRFYSRREMLDLIVRYGVGSAALGASGVFATGCGGGKDDPTLSVRRTGRFVSAVNLQPVGDIAVDLGRTFVTLNNGIPTELGWELPDRALKTLPYPKFDTEDTFYLPLPPEANTTPFKYMVLLNWANGRRPVGIADIPHILAAFCIAPPGAASEGLRDETAPVTNSEEIPAGYLIGSGIPGNIELAEGGVGVAYEDPSSAHVQPRWNSFGQNYFYFKGHLNGVGMLATYGFLKEERTIVLPMSQPVVYPKPGYYPTRSTVTWDSDKSYHVFKLTDFVPAGRFL
ncbi:MAG: hypothetical protein SFU56_20470 [Capsulimonadales bacterium]|nr:hypothetical protein [Capsulimonadales bacterium]